LRRHAEGVGHAIEEGEHGGDIDRLRNLIFSPTGVAEFLDVSMSGAGCGMGDDFDVIQKRALRRC
jgi:hypothetical protein